MKKINKPLVAIILLVSLNAILIIRLNSNGKYINELQQGIVTINNNHLFAKEKNDKFISNSELRFTDANKKIHDFDSLLLIKKKPLLVLRIHENNCNDCVHQSLIHINELLTNNDLPFDVVVSSSYTNLDLLRQDFDLKFLSVQKDKRINLELDLTSQPYIFYIAMDGRVSNLFVPEYDLMELFLAYLKSVVNSTVVSS
ncbi:hypothetical protein [Roseivirga sp.]|uniref:hypothetical protein n=1 Tax=Roseivirga sp. TaxID=1964215 RepID=UPI003B8DABB8